jgi:hypothetical protein
LLAVAVAAMVAATEAVAMMVVVMRCARSSERL